MAARPQPKYVATLLVFFESEDEPYDCLPIVANDNFFIGRNKNLCKFTFNDQRLSNKHLQIHCIVFQEDDSYGIPPLVYAEDLSSNGTYLEATTDSAATTQEQSRVFLSKKRGPVLLSQGDKLYLTPDLCLLLDQDGSYERGKSRRDAEQMFDSIQRAEQQMFKDRYVITPRIIGSGGHGSVFVAIHKKTQQQLACKIVNLDLDNGDDDDDHDLRRHENPTSELRQALRAASRQKRRQDALAKHFREFDVLKDLCHPNIIKLQKVFWSFNTLYIFQELITGGDLFSFIESKGGNGVTDVEAAVIIRQVLKGVEYLHDRDIVHRDLKPDNILMTAKSADARVIITDFDAARFIPDSGQEQERHVSAKRRMISVVGTYEFCAPEVHNKNKAVREKGYSKAVDMWSVGAIAAMLLSGDVIFVDRSNPLFTENPKKIIFDLASECNLDILDYGEQWKNVGRRPKDFIRKLFILDESQRMTTKQALQHPWLNRKCYAGELEAMYKRAIKEWQPTRKVFRLVERLETSKLAEDTAADAVQQNRSKTSPFFSFPNASPPSAYASAFMRSQPVKRVHTPLPAITEEPGLVEDISAYRPALLNHVTTAQNSPLLSDSAPNIDNTFSQLTISHNQNDDDMDNMIEDLEASPILDGPRGMSVEDSFQNLEYHVNGERDSPMSQELGYETHAALEKRPRSAGNDDTLYEYLVGNQAQHGYIISGIAQLAKRARVC